MKVKVIAMTFAVALLLVGLVSGTLAWLTAQTTAVVNTFSTSDINVELKETTTVYKMVPGCEISKDPKAKVLKGSEECWLFVEITKNSTYDSYMNEPVIADGWTPVQTAWTTNTAQDGTVTYTRTYGRTVNAAAIAAETSYSILSGDKVSVKTSVTKAMMNAIDNETTVKPTLTFQVFATQLHKNATEDFDINTAWANVSAS